MQAAVKCQPERIQLSKANSSQEMGSLKRKDAPGAPSVPKSATRNSVEQPRKRQKSESKTAPQGAKTSDLIPRKAPVLSRLKEEEPLFPRGGGSVLSPLEQKQIQIQAKKDVLFEQDSGGASQKADKPTKKKRASVSKNDQRPRNLARDEDAVRVESLNYKVCPLPAICCCVETYNDLAFSEGLACAGPGV